MRTILQSWPTTPPLIATPQFWSSSPPFSQQYLFGAKTMEVFSSFSTGPERRLYMMVKHFSISWRQAMTLHVLDLQQLSSCRNFYSIRLSPPPKMTATFPHQSKDQQSAMEEIVDTVRLETGATRTLFDNLFGPTAKTLAQIIYQGDRTKLRISIMNIV